MSRLSDTLLAKIILEIPQVFQDILLFLYIPKVVFFTSEAWDYIDWNLYSDHTNRFQDLYTSLHSHTYSVARWIWWTMLCIRRVYCSHMKVMWSKLSPKRNCQLLRTVYPPRWCTSALSLGFADSRFSTIRSQRTFRLIRSLMKNNEREIAKKDNAEEKKTKKERKKSKRIFPINNGIDWLT